MRLRPRAATGLTKICILLADDHAVLRARLKELLATQPNMEPVGEVGDGAAAVRLAESLRPDVLLLDVTMPGNEYLAALRVVRQRAHTVRTLLLTMHENGTMQRAAEAELLTAGRP